MNRIVFAIAALVALFALPNNSFACSGHGCRAHHHHHHVRHVAPVRVAVAPVARASCCRIDLGARLATFRAEREARWAKFRAERAASGAAFRASLAQMFKRVPRPVVAAPVRTCAPVAAAPRRSCGLLTRIAGCLHSRCR